MKKLLIFAFVSVLGYAAFAQSPVSWSFKAKKIATNRYEIHLTANIAPKWHLYSQTQPEDAIASPTVVTIANNPLFTLSGKVKEVGKKQKFHDKKIGATAYQYSKLVDFVQVIVLKAAIKTKINGSVEFQTCNDEKCLPPKTIPFSIDIL